MRGAFYGWFIIMLQLGLVLSVSAHAVLGENDDGAKQSMLMLCCGLQLATAAWHVVGDANDRLAALVACAGSLMECASTGMLLAISYVEEAQKDDEHEAMLHGMAAACASLLTWAVFLPIVQELLYDVLLLQTTRTIIERRKRGAYIACALWLPTARAGPGARGGRGPRCAMPLSCSPFSYFNHLQRNARALPAHQSESPTPSQTATSE